MQPFLYETKIFKKSIDKAFIQCYNEHMNNHSYVIGGEFMNKHNKCSSHNHSECSCHHEHNTSGCGCGHEHGSHEEDNLIIWRIAIGAILFFIAGLLINNAFFKTLTYICAYIVIGYDIVIGAIKRIFKGKFLDENFLMSIASVGAFAIGEHPEAVAVMLFYQVGEYLQNKAIHKSRKSISDLMNVRPDHANVERSGEIITVAPEDVKVGEIIVIKAGERVPLDGIVTHGESFMDTRALTGESVPRSAKVGSEIISGSINAGSPVYMRVTHEYEDCTVAKILELAENTQSRKSAPEKFITKFARYYTPIVVTAAILLMLIPPLFDGLNFAKWIYRGLVFLVVSCPCALVISIPLGFFSAIGRASRDGILIKGGNYIESLSKVGTVVFDKTGTLTKGVFNIKEIYRKAEYINLLEIAAYAEYYSNHPIAKTILEEYSEEIDKERISDYKEIAGKGISAKLDGKAILAGNMRLMRDNGIKADDVSDHSGTVVYIAVDNDYAGYILICDEERSDSIVAVSGLVARGIDTAMLTGDSEAPAKCVSDHLGITKTYSGLLPNDKVSCMEQIMRESKKSCAFVGDGINDAPVIALADIGIAMGATGSAGAIEAADVVLMTDEPSKLLRAIDISKKTMAIIKQNIVLSIGVKVAAMLLGALGISGMWLAIFADTGVALLAVANSLRIMKR